MGKACCFFGHRRMEEAEKWNAQLGAVIEKLITEEGVDTFFFGSKSEFNDLCYDRVTAAKAAHPHIRRVYVRAEYPQIREVYEQYLLERYEYTYYPETIRRAGRAVYVERNREMVDRSDFCVVYYDATYRPTKRKSGTRLALDYAVKRHKQIIYISVEAR